MAFKVTQHGGLPSGTSSLLLSYGMTHDIFDFWAECPPDTRVHPQDRQVFERQFVGDMGFDLRCLPACFAEPLRTASVVLLYLSPGWAQADVDEADDPRAQARYADRRKGMRPLDGKDEHPKHYQWWSSRTKIYGEPETVRDKVAILNLGAYHSPNFKALGLTRFGGHPEAFARGVPNAQDSPAVFA